MCGGCNHQSNLEEKLKGIDYSKNSQNNYNSITHELINPNYRSKKQYIKPTIYRQDPLTDITF